LRKLSPADIANLMDLSDPLAQLNFSRYADWCPAVYAGQRQAGRAGFRWRCLRRPCCPSELSADDLDFAQKQVRILSGLYGILKPLDLMQPYRLEMGTKFANKAARISTPSGASACLARSMMNWPSCRGRLRSTSLPRNISRRRRAQDQGRTDPAGVRGLEEWQIQDHQLLRQTSARPDDALCHVLNRLSEPEGLKDFDYDGYAFEPSVSDEKSWVFRRRQD
jgi:cytoplasmic iron level regulating protein YaaA (DUF328/UPF0246 family)